MVNNVESKETYVCVDLFCWPILDMPLLQTNLTYFLKYVNFRLYFKWLKCLSNACKIVYFCYVSQSATSATTCDILTFLVDFLETDFTAYLILNCERMCTVYYVYSSQCVNDGSYMVIVNISVLLLSATIWTITKVKLIKYPCMSGQVSPLHQWYQL